MPQQVAEERTYDNFVARRELWISCLGSDDKHGIQQQILEGVVDAVVYRMTIKMRNLAPRAADGSGVELNGLLFRMLDNSFFHAQTAAIRRMTDQYPIAHSGQGSDRSVYSLSALVSDMRDWAPHMTRSWLVDAGAHLNEQFSWRERDRHEQIDWLCGVEPHQRSDDDRVRVEFFNYLLFKIDSACSDISTWATKYVAHASSPTSRKGIEKISVSWQALWSAYQALAEVAQVVRWWVLEGPHVVVMPYMSSDVALWLDRPLATGTDELQAIRETWNDSRGETEDWPSSEEDLKSEFSDFLRSS